MFQEISQLEVKKGIRSNNKNFQALLGDHLSGFRRNTKYEHKLLNELNEKKMHLLKKIETWKECPSPYRYKLFNRLRNVDISRKEACSKIDGIKQELGVLGFNLRLNPTWVRGLLKLIDEILDQTEYHQRPRLSQECGLLENQLGALKNACRLYQLEKEI